MPLGLIAFLAVANYLHKKPDYISKANKSKAWFFLLVALSASLPIMVSYEQRGFYLNTSMPYFAMAMAVAFAPLTGAFEGVNHKFVNGFKIILLIAFVAGIGLTVAKAGRAKRDADRLAAIEAIKKIAPKGSVIYCNDVLWMDWSLHNYLQRFGEISLSQKEPVPYSLYIQLKTDKTPVPDNYMLRDKGCEWVDVYVWVDTFKSDVKLEIEKPR